MRGAIPPGPQYTSWSGAQLKGKHRDNFTFIRPLTRKCAWAPKLLNGFGWNFVSQAYTKRR